MFHSTGNSVCLFSRHFFSPIVCRSSTSSSVSPALPLPRNTRVKCGVRCFCPLMPFLNPSPTSLAKTSAPWLNNGCILAHLDATRLKWSGHSNTKSWRGCLLSPLHFRLSKWHECNKRQMSLGAVKIRRGGGAPPTASINSLCAQLFGFCAAVSGYLHLLWVFNVSCPETRAPWWSSLAALPSTGRGMCWSWRSVRTTHHLEPRNMWWALRCHGKIERAPVGVQVERKKKVQMNNNRFEYLVWKLVVHPMKSSTNSELFFFPSLCQKSVNGCIHFIFHLWLHWESHFPMRLCFLSGPHQGDSAGVRRLLQAHAADRREQPQARHSVSLQK